MKCTYKITETCVAYEDKQYTTYGIDAVDEFEKVIASFSDVFFDRAKAEEFVGMCNDGSLSVIHFGEVIEDVLAQQYMI